MKTRVLVGISIAAVAWVCLLPVLAGAPVKISEVAPAEDIAAEAKAKIDLLGSYVENEERYQEAKQDNAIPQAAGVLACLAQAIAEHDKKSDSKVAAADLRDAAIEIRDSESLADAKKALSKVKEAWAGKSSGESKVEHDWSKLIDIDLTMEEVKARNNKIRRLVRRSKDPQADSLHATTLAVLALTIYASSHDVKKVKTKDDIEKWKGYATEYQKRMTALAAAFKKKDAVEAKKLWLKGAEACNACHKNFQENE